MISVALVLASMLVHANSSGTTITLFREPSTSFVRRYLERQDAENLSPNHPFAGFSDPTAADGGAAPPQAPPEFQERTVRVYLGRGKETYHRGQDALLRWRMHDGSSWARIVLGRSPERPELQPRNMVTVAKAAAGLAWCVNPCQIVYERRNTPLRFSTPPGTNPYLSPRPAKRKRRNRAPSAKRTAQGEEGGETGRLWAGKSPLSAPEWAAFLPGLKHTGRQSAVAYATKEGHLIEGEERMRVLHFCGRGGDDSVWFEVYSVSRGSGVAGGMLFPFIQSMQRRFFREQALTMRRIVGATTAAVT